MFFHKTEVFEEKEKKGKGNNIASKHRLMHCTLLAFHQARGTTPSACCDDEDPFCTSHLLSDSENRKKKGRRW
jgi:hypothetical protein